MPTHQIEYQVFPDVASLPEGDQVLLSAAVAALANSYSPYSNFKVGAAVRCQSGRVVPGWNTENAAYPMCLCAEPSALAAAAAQCPGEAVTAMAITVKSPTQVLSEPASPCGSCRQQLHEHEQRFGQPMRLILRGETGPVYVFESAGALLPFGFGGNLL